MENNEKIKSSCMKVERATIFLSSLELTETEKCFVLDGKVLGFFVKIKFNKKNKDIYEKFIKSLKETSTGNKYTSWTNFNICYNLGKKLDGGVMKYYDNYSIILGFTKEKIDAKDAVWEK